MTASTISSRGAGTFPHGVHPAEHKELSQDSPLAVLPTPKQVTIPLVQHLGAPAEALVKTRQDVQMGEMIAKPAGFISAAVHASISGKVGLGCAVTLPNGRRVQAVPIVAAETQPLAGADLLDDVFGGHWPTDVSRFEPRKITDATSEAGVVGLGGAAFPSHVKLLRNEKKPIDTLLLNGCECEPYLTADYRLMLEFPDSVICGGLLAARANGAERIIAVVEDNKPRAIDAMRKAAANTGIEVTVVPTKYPQGGERQAIYAITGRAVPTGGLPLDVGVMVVNVATAAAIARAVVRGKALTHRIVTVTGAGVVRPANVLAPIGASYRELIDFCGGLRPEASRVIAGGPMMGFALGDLDTPVTKGTSGITVLTARDVAKAEETNCLRCGKCVDTCPLNLVPSKLAVAARSQDWDLARKYHMPACIECGCCAFTCPAAIPLVQLIRMGKTKLPMQ